MTQQPNSSPEAAEAKAAQEKTVHVFGHEIAQSDLIKAGGLIAFLVLISLIVAALWDSLSLIFQPDGTTLVIEHIQSQGAAGVLVLLGLQFLQIIVAFIPGEVVQVAAGMLYGPLWGSLLILLGCVISSAIVYQLVHRLGAPFVHAMVDEKYLKRFYAFERSGKLSVVVFILFLIPAMPKDVFTYIVPLTGMRMRTFLVLTTIGRIPGVVISTYAAAGLAEGDITKSLIIFGIAAVIVIFCLIFRNKIFEIVGNQRKFRRMEEERTKER